MFDERRPLLLASALSLLSGCAQLPLERVDRDLHEAIAPRLAAPTVAADVIWRRDAAADARAQARAAELVADGVGSDEAVQLALLANPDLQVQLEQLGVARAAWLEASQIANPLLGWSRRGLRGGPGANVEFSVAQDLLSAFQLPGRRRSANAALQAARLEAAQAVLTLATAVRQQYWRCVVAGELAAYAGQREQLGQLMFELAQRYHSAGNLSLVEREQHRDAAMTARAEGERARTEALHQRAALLRLLGVTGSHDDLTLADTLPALPATDPSLADLEARALRQRVDLQALHRQADAELLRASQARHWRWLPGLEGQFSTEKDPGGDRVSGPAVAMTLPLFNAQQAAVAANDARARLALRRTEALALDVRTQLRNAAAELAAARRIAQSWRDEVLPAREAITEGATREYFFMLKGPWDPLSAQQQLLTARMGALEALRDYWLARTALAAAAGEPALADATAPRP